MSGASCYFAVGWHGLESVASMISSSDGTMISVICQTRTIDDNLLWRLGF